MRPDRMLVGMHLLLLFPIAMLWATCALAAPAPSGMGGGMGIGRSGGGDGGTGGGHGHGHMDDIMFLLQHHGKITRTVAETADGIRANTTSDDPAVASALHSHVAAMRSLLEGGGVIRECDPLFAAVFEVGGLRYHDRYRYQLPEFETHHPHHYPSNPSNQHRSQLSLNVTDLSNGVETHESGDGECAISLVQVSD